LRDPPSPDGHCRLLRAIIRPGGANERGYIHYIYQQISIPMNASSALLTWAHRVRISIQVQQFCRCTKRRAIRNTNDSILAVCFQHKSRRPSPGRSGVQRSMT
jgi:hypothetical protein